MRVWVRVEGVRRAVHWAAQSLTPKIGSLFFLGTPSSFVIARPMPFLNTSARTRKRSNCARTDGSRAATQMRSVRHVERLTRTEAGLGLAAGTETAGSWHDEFRGSAYIFVGGVSYDLNEGDLVAVFSQYGRVTRANLVRDKDTGKSRGYAFLCYEDERSTILAVDNLNGITLAGRTIQFVVVVLSLAALPWRVMWCV